MVKIPMKKVVFVNFSGIFISFISLTHNVLFIIKG